MPGRIVVALEDQALADDVATLLTAEGEDVVALADSMAALSALEAAQTAQVLISSLSFQPGKPNGVALARMARLRRPGIRTAFLGSADMERYTAGLGQLLQEPASAEELAALARKLLHSQDQN
jgi:hypothetical protein